MSRQLGGSWASMEYEDSHQDSSESSESDGDLVLDASEPSLGVESLGASIAPEEDYDATPRPRAIRSRQQASALQASLSSPANHAKRTSRSHLNQSTNVQRSQQLKATATAMGPSLIMPSSPDGQIGDPWAQSSNIQQSRRNLRSSTVASGSGSPSRASRKPRLRRSVKPEPEERPIRLGMPEQKEKSPPFYPKLLWNYVVYPVGEFAMSTLGQTVRYLKPFLAQLLAIALILGVLIGLRSMLTSAISGALSPLCYIPGSSYLNLPFCEPQEEYKSPVEFDELMTVQSAFEDVLATSMNAASLPLDMKRSESSIRDLKHVVKYSTLPSRMELVFEFDGFIEVARQASSDLSRFNMRIGGSVDRILSTNRWTLQVLDGIADRAASEGAISRFLKNVNPINTFRAPGQTADKAVLDQYIRHTTAVEEQIAHLIEEATVLLGILQNLDNRLDVIQDIATRDGVTASISKDELLAHLWTKFGGNRASVQKVERELRLLKDVTTYRKIAWNHVTGTVLKLQEIAAGLEDLRERVAGPEILGTKEELPLLWHLENIKMGVERLEGVRGDTRRLQEEGYRKVLDRGEQSVIDAGTVLPGGPRGSASGK